MLKLFRYFFIWKFNLKNELEKKKIALDFEVKYVWIFLILVCTWTHGCSHSKAREYPIYDSLLYSLEKRSLMKPVVRWLSRKPWWSFVFALHGAGVASIHVQTWSSYKCVKLGSHTMELVLISSDTSRVSLDILNALEKFHWFVTVCVFYN